MAIGTWMWYFYTTTIIQEGTFIIVPGVDITTGPSWPVTGKSIIKIYVDDIPGQHIVMRVLCGIPVRLERERYECYYGKLHPGVDNYIGIETKNENIMMGLRSVLEYGELKPHLITFKIITDKDEVEKIVQEIFDLGA